MQNSSIPTPDTEYISQDDESEAERVALLNGGVPQDLGDVHYLTDDDVRQYSINDFGFDFPIRNSVPE